MIRAMRRTVLPLLASLAGCPEAAPPAQPPAARAEPDTSWIRSDKLDADVQEMVLRAYDADLAFPFRVRTRDEETIVRLRPSDLGGVVRDANVVAVRCAPPATEQPPDDAWRAKVDPDVRTVHGAQSACWTAVALRFAHDPSPDEWQGAVDAGVVAHARDARSALVWAPVRAIPRIAAMAFVERIEPFDAPAPD